jgi:hypothetical protein
MPSITAVHHALCDVDSATSDIAIGVDVLHPLNRSGVKAHAQFKLGVIPQNATDLDRAPSRRFCISEEDQRHPVASRRITDYLLEVANKASLLIHRQLGIRDDVHE